ncbi:MAG TPA: hypothetical protein VJQ09_03720 [Candidatus Limnocylindria bacterium]|nr:hypothetical protein [Candidatus Limnocylindria bacterium]
MTRAERVLYHQVHPLKLAADIGSTLVAIPLLWDGELLLGLAIALGIPVAASAVVLATADLERIATSPLGAYLRRYMTPAVQALRLAMGLLVLYGAWVHSVAVIVVAIIVIVLAWTYGRVLARA